MCSAMLQEVLCDHVLSYMHKYLKFMCKYKYQVL